MKIHRTKVYKRSLKYKHNKNKLNYINLIYKFIMIKLMIKIKKLKNNKK